MKWRLFFVCAVVYCSSALCSQAKAQTANQYWWHDRLTQADRNACILRAALSFPDNTYVGVECKEWVQMCVVYPVSRRAVLLPLNSPSCDWMWQWSPDVEVVARDRWDGVSWPSGEIVQCQIRTKTGGLSKHTFIIMSTDQGGVNVIECNLSNDRQVRHRYVTWANLKTSITHYTLYRVK